MDPISGQRISDLFLALKKDSSRMITMPLREARRSRRKDRPSTSMSSRDLVANPAPAITLWMDRSRRLIHSMPPPILHSSSPIQLSLTSCLMCHRLRLAVPTAGPGVSVSRIKDLCQDLGAYVGCQDSPTSGRRRRHLLPIATAEDPACRLALRRLRHHTTSTRRRLTKHITPSSSHVPFDDTFSFFLIHFRYGPCMFSLNLLASPLVST